MVTGIERWKEYFNDYKDKYVLIGGAACNLLEEELDMNPRATKDLDLVLVVEALTPDFGARLWDFIKSANYAGRSKGENEFKHEYYRFTNPEDKAYPKQIELFARSTRNPQPAIRCTHRTHKCRRRPVQPVSHLDG